MQYHAIQEQDSKAIARNTNTNSSNNSHSKDKVYMVPSAWMSSFMQCIQPQPQSNANDNVSDMDAKDTKPGKIINATLLSNQHNHAMHVSIPVLDADPSSESNGSGNGIAHNHSNHHGESESVLDERSERRKRWTRIKQAEEQIANRTNTNINANANANTNHPRIRNNLTFGKDYTLVGEGLWTLLSHKFGFDTKLEFEVHTQDKNERMYMAGTETGLIGGSLEDVDVDGDVNVDVNDPANDGGDSNSKVVRIGDQLVSLPPDGKFDYSVLPTNDDEDVHGHGHASAIPNNIVDDRSTGGLVSEDDSARVSLYSFFIQLDCIRSFCFTSLQVIHTIQKLIIANRLFLTFHAVTLSTPKTGGR
jgi:hypothetical protein